MKTFSLSLDDLRVETFATEATPRDGDLALGYMHTRDPKDCPETLPQFCRPTDLC